MEDAQYKDVDGFPILDDCGFPVVGICPYCGEGQSEGALEPHIEYCHRNPANCSVDEE